MSGGAGRRAPGGGPWHARKHLLLALTLLAIPAASAEEIAVRLKDDGHVYVRATAAPLASVLDRLAALTETRVTYQGPPPRRLVTLEISAASQAEAVLRVLLTFGADYAVSTDFAGTRVLTLVVANEAPGSHADAGTVGTETPLPPDTLPPDALAPDTSPPDAVPADASPSEAGELGSPEAGGDTSTEGIPLLPGTFVPGTRATGQTMDWGVPPFEPPEPPGPKAYAPEGEVPPSEPGASGAGTGLPAPPRP